jgi:hypothetical protein
VQVSIGDSSPRRLSVQLLCGALAGPLFFAAFTAIGATRRGYDWRRYPVSSLAVGRRGWQQRVNFILAGVLYICAAMDLARCDRRRIGPRSVPALVASVGVGLIGSGLFVTDYVGDLTPRQRSRSGQIHNLCGIPVFVGIPVAGLLSAAAAARSGDYRWACYSAASSGTMAGSLVLFGGAIKGQSRLRGKSGVLQRITLATGLGWLSSLSLRGARQAFSSG